MGFRLAKRNPAFPTSKKTMKNFLKVLCLVTLAFNVTYGAVYRTGVAEGSVTYSGGGSSSGGSATNVVSSTNTGLLYISPLPLGNNGAVDFRTNQPNFVGQIGVGMDTANAGSGIYLFGAKSNTVGGWDGQFNFPAGIAQVGSQWNLPTNSNYRFAWNYLNGNPKWATRTNIVNGSSSSFDSGWAFAQMNPYGCALIWTPTTTTNVQYKWTAGGIIGTNVTGDVIYWDEDPFGLVVGTISREWPAQETNQAGSYVILLGGGGSTKPFHIADNHTEGTQLGQFSYLTIDRRGLTNVASPWGIGFPLRTTNVWSETNANFRWSLFSDYKTGKLYVTNDQTKLHSLHIDNTNTGAGMYGKFAENVVEHNFAGSVSFNAPANTGFDEAWTFDGAAAHRLGFVIKSGNYPVLAYGAGMDFRLVQSSVSDLQSGISSQTHTNMLTITNNVLAVHTPGFRVDGKQTNVAALHAPSITLYNGANSSIISNTASEQLSFQTAPGTTSATLFTGNLRVFNNGGNAGRIGLRSADGSTVPAVDGWTNGIKIVDNGSGFGNGYMSNSVLVGATIWRSNTVTAAAVAAAITNGDFGQITMSNALQAFWMSNNVMNWKKLAP